MNDGTQPLDIARHDQYMRRCIELAKIAGANGNTPVGSIVVLDDQVVGEGIENLPSGTSITGHAEILACQAAVDDRSSTNLASGTLYSTAEPCFMCAYAIRQCQISLVVYGAETPGIGGVTSNHPILTAAIAGWKPPPQTISGVLSEECSQLKKFDPRR